MSNVIRHHGILGMKWGIRRTPAQLGHDTSKKGTDRKSSESSKKSSDSGQKTVKEMSDEELRSMIKRLELEKRYSDLSKPKEKAKMFDGKRFMVDVLEKSGKNISTQAVTYGMGRIVNEMLRDIAGEDVVNPKKGQKDK